MKNLLVGLFLLAPSIMYAQGVGFGLKGGVNFANVEASDVDTESITSFHVGPYINLNLSETFGITPEVLWTGYGSEFNNAKLICNYISVPVMLRFKFIPLVFVEAGPQINFLLDAEFDGDDYKDQLKNNEFGLGLGAGVNLPLGLNGGVRYVLGFTDISEVDNSSIKNRTWQIYLGWTLGGG